MSMNRYAMRSRLTALGSVGFVSCWQYGVVAVDAGDRQVLAEINRMYDRWTSVIMSPASGAVSPVAVLGQRLSLCRAYSCRRDTPMCRRVTPIAVVVTRLGFAA